MHGIQLIPITPMVSIMFEPDWVQTAYPNFKAGCEADEECVESGFVTFLYAEQVSGARFCPNGHLLVRIW